MRLQKFQTGFQKFYIRNGLFALVMAVLMGWFMPKVTRVVRSIVGVPNRGIEELPALLDEEIHFNSTLLSEKGASTTRVLFNSSNCVITYAVSKERRGLAEVVKIIKSGKRDMQLHCLEGELIYVERWNPYSHHRQLDMWSDKREALEQFLLELRRRTDHFVKSPR